MTALKRGIILNADRAAMTSESEHSEKEQSSSESEPETRVSSGRQEVNVDTPVTLLPGADEPTVVEATSVATLPLVIVQTGPVAT